MPIDTNKIRKLRERQGLSQADAAAGMGMKSRQQWYQYETGKRTPSLETLEKIAKLLKCSARDLLSDDAAKA